jgi:Hg(II)-responsive transcriptional regulator
MWMTIARAARAAGVGVETIRFYERRGLIAQPRKPASGFREYDADAVARIRFIRQAQELGFSLREIEELLSLRADPKADCAEVRVQATTKRDEVTKKIANLKRIRMALDTLIATCPGSGALKACTILDAIEQVPVGQFGPGLARTVRTKENTTSKRRGALRAMKNATFTIDGMHCDGCAETIRALLKMEPGVQTSTVSFKERNARVLYDPARTSGGRLIAAIERGGYKVSRQTA